MPLFSREKTDQRGFTLPEILTVLAIIGTLSSIGVVSYESVRANSRDLKRVSDLKQIQSSLELYFETHSSYPGDGRPGDDGMILGLDGTRTFSDVGFTSLAATDGTVYMLTVPKNPEPGGSPYVYRSIDRDGSNCDRNDCEAYALLFTLERGSGSLAAGPGAITPSGVAGASGGSAGAGVTTSGGEIIGIGAAQEQLARAAEAAALSVVGFAENEQVEIAAEVAVAPAVTVAAVANTALSTSSFATYGALFVTQPVLLLRRRKRKAWGTAYNTLSRLGEDLVIVRLRDAASGRIIKSTVTDAEGRFSFLVQQGKYRVEASKHGFTFPSALTNGMRDDGPFLDLYHGQEIEVGGKGAILTPNIPIDPVVGVESDDAIRRLAARRRIKGVLAGWTLIIGAGALVIRPSVVTGLLFAAQVTAFLLFRRLASARQPKRWGTVFDQETRKPVTNAIARVFEARFNKLLESQVTDRHGRYHFRVGGNVYYLTVSKSGYLKTETAPVDLSGRTEPTVIASDLPLARIVGTPPGSGESDLSQASRISRDGSSESSALPADEPTEPQSPPASIAPPQEETQVVQVEVPVLPPEKPPEEPRENRKGWLNSL